MLFIRAINARAKLFETINYKEKKIIMQQRRSIENWTDDCVNATYGSLINKLDDVCMRVLCGRDRVCACVQKRANGRDENARRCNIRHTMYIVLYIRAKHLTVQYHLNIFIFHVKITLVRETLHSVGDVNAARIL